MIKITRDRWTAFEYYWCLKVLDVPHYRYGQAFIVFFHEEIKNIGGIDLNIEDKLWSTTDKDLASKIIQSMVEFEVNR